jgi:hypothetical protein
MIEAEKWRLTFMTLGPSSIYRPPVRRSLEIIFPFHYSHLLNISSHYAASCELVWARLEREVIRPSHARLEIGACIKLRYSQSACVPSRGHPVACLYRQVLSHLISRPCQLPMIKNIPPMSPLHRNLKRWTIHSSDSASGAGGYSGTACEEDSNGCTGEAEGQKRIPDLEVRLLITPSHLEDY